MLMSVAVLLDVGCACSFAFVFIALTAWCFTTCCNPKPGCLLASLVTPVAFQLAGLLDGWPCLLLVCSVQADLCGPCLLCILAPFHIFVS